MHRFGVPWHIAVSLAIVAALVMQYQIWRRNNQIWKRITQPKRRQRPLKKENAVLAELVKEGILKRV